MRISTSWNFGWLRCGPWTSLQLSDSGNTISVHVIKRRLFCFRDGLEWLRCLVTLIQKLLSSSAWKDVLHTQLSGSIQQLKQVSFCSISHFLTFFCIMTVYPSFLPCDAMRCTVFGIVILSVCPSVCLSVCPSHSWTVSTWFDLRS